MVKREDVTAAREPRVSFVNIGDQTNRVQRTERRMRVLFSDGSTVDVFPDRDDSDVRGALLAWLKKERIEGGSWMPAQESLPVVDKEQP